MLEIRPKDAIGSLVETVEAVDTMRIAETEYTIETEDLKKFQLNQN